MTNGKWRVEVDAPIAPEFYKVQHMVRAWGELASRQDSVDKAISANEDNDSFQAEKTFWIDGERDPSSVASAELPPPNRYPADSPGWAVAEVIGDWRRHDWQGMARWVHGLGESHLTDRIIARGEYKFHELPLADRVKACKSAFQSWEVLQARIGEVNEDADPQFPMDNAQVTVHLKTTLHGKEKDVDLLWVAIKPDAKTGWGVDIETVSRN